VLKTEKEERERLGLVHKRGGTKGLFFLIGENELIQAYIPTGSQVKGNKHEKERETNIRGT